MNKKNRRITNPIVDNKNWQILFDTQFNNLQKNSRIATLWINGFSKLGLDNSKVPSVEYLNAVSQKYTKWKFIQTKDVVIASGKDWNELTVKRMMPITNFVRTPKELYYCDEPDKWHDIIGHIPFLMSEEYSRMYQNISRLYLQAYEKSEKYAKEVAAIISYIIEVGLIEENKKLKAFGATLYSSAGELESAFKKGNYSRFSLSEIQKEGSYDRSQIQQRYFIIKSLDEINRVVNQYKKNTFKL